MECGLVLERSQFTSWAIAEVPLSKAPNPQLLTGAGSTGCLRSGLSTACACVHITVFVCACSNKCVLYDLYKNACVYDRVETEFPSRGINKGPSSSSLITASIQTETHSLMGNWGYVSAACVTVRQ